MIPAPGEALVPPPVPLRTHSLKRITTKNAQESAAAVDEFGGDCLEQQQHPWFQNDDVQVWETTMTPKKQILTAKLCSFEQSERFNRLRIWHRLLPQVRAEEAIRDCRRLRWETDGETFLCAGVSVREAKLLEGGGVRRGEIQKRGPGEKFIPFFFCVICVRKKLLSIQSEVRSIFHSSADRPPRHRLSPEQQRGISPLRRDSLLLILPPPFGHPLLLPPPQTA